MFSRFLAVLSAVFLCLAQTPVLHGASSSDSSSSLQQTINYLECKQDIKYMYFFKSDHFSQDGSWLLFQTTDRTFLYNTQTNEANQGVSLASDNIERCMPITKLDGYKPLIKGQGIFSNTVYLMKYKDIEYINVDFDSKTPKDQWPYTIEKHFAHDGTQKNAFFSYDKKFLIAQSDKMITIAPIGEQSKCTLTPKEFDNQDFKHIALSPNNRLAICTQANKIYFIDINDYLFVRCKKSVSKFKEERTILQKASQTPGISMQNAIPWWKKCTNVVTRDPWKALAIAQGAVIATTVIGYALYKWKPNFFNTFKCHF